MFRISEKLDILVRNGCTSQSMHHVCLWKRSYYNFFTSHSRTYNGCQKSLRHLQKIMKIYNLLSISNIIPCTHPHSPLKQCWSVPETLDIIAHEKCFHYPMYFSEKPTLFKGRRGTNALSRLKTCKVSQDFWQVL